MRIRPLHIVQTILAALFVAALCLALLCVSGCRTSEIGTIHLIIPESAACGQLAQLTITQTLYAEDISVGQGKSVPVKALADWAASAAQTGNPSAAVEDSSKTEAPVAPAKPAATAPAGETEATPPVAGGESPTPAPSSSLSPSAPDNPASAATATQGE